MKYHKTEAPCVLCGCPLTIVHYKTEQWILCETGGCMESDSP